MLMSRCPSVSKCAAPTCDRFAAAERFRLLRGRRDIASESQRPGDLRSLAGLAFCHSAERSPSQLEFVLAKYPVRKLQKLRGGQASLDPPHQPHLRSATASGFGHFLCDLPAPPHPSQCHGPVERSSSHAG